MFWYIIISIYIISLLGNLAFFDKDVREFKESGAGNYFDDKIIVGISAMIPIMNTFCLATSIRDIIVEAYTIWKVKRIVKRIAKKYGIKELL